MSSLVLSQTAVYQLQQLSKVVRDKTGMRHRLSDPQSVMSLLRYGATSPDANIFTYFSRFTNELEEDQKDYLQSEGLMIPAALIKQMQHFTEHRHAL